MQEKIPIIQIEDVLLVSIQVDMHDKLALQLQDDLTEKIAQTGARGVLLEISSLEVVDSFIGRIIGNISAMARVLDAMTVVVGMQPAVAITLVELGLTLEGVHTALNVSRGMALLKKLYIGGLMIAGRNTIRVESEGDVVKVRQAVRVLAVEIKLSLVDQTKVVTAASELGRNLLIYGGGGDVHLEIAQEGARRGVRVVFADQGPGIPDIEQALRDGFTSGSGMGLGLGGAKRLVNDFDLVSSPGQGTRVTITKWK